MWYLLTDTDPTISDRLICVPRIRQYKYLKNFNIHCKRYIFNIIFDREKLRPNVQSIKITDNIQSYNHRKCWRRNE